MKTGNSKGLGEVLKTLKRPNNSDRTQQQSADKATAVSTGSSQRAVNVNISAEASAQSAQGSERSEKVARIKNEVQSGNYNVSSSDIAKSLINELGIGNEPIVG